MSKVSVAALLLTGALALSADQAGAQAIADQLAACKNEGAAVEARIAACGRVIQEPTTTNCAARR